MIDLDTMYELVRSILVMDRRARENDMWLYAQVIKRKNMSVMNEPFYIVMCRAKDYGLPAFESVSRARRKVQMEHEELKPSGEVQAIREEYEQMYFDWAKG